MTASVGNIVLYILFLWIAPVFVGNAICNRLSMRIMASSSDISFTMAGTFFNPTIFAACNLRCPDIIS